MISVEELRANMVEAGAVGKPMAARFDGECGECRQAILKGDTVAYIPALKLVFCPSCACEDHS